MGTIEKDPVHKYSFGSRIRKKLILVYGRKVLKKIQDFQARQSLVPNDAVVSNKYFDFLEAFSTNWKTIRDEAFDVLEYRNYIPGFEEISPDQYRLAKNKKWKTFVLFGFGERLHKNTKMTPKTAELLEKVPNLQSAMFSILAPGYHIPAHRGVTKGVLRAHLGLIIPNDSESCKMRVDDKIISWVPGKSFVFDDTYEHEVWNDTGEERVVLIFDFDRPMKLSGRVINKLFMKLMKLTAFYQGPKANLERTENEFFAVANDRTNSLWDEAFDGPQILFKSKEEFLDFFEQNVRHDVLSDEGYSILAGKLEGINSTIAQKITNLERTAESIMEANDVRN